mmetsp:Transcript_387/g.1350  ORF Transcript_387/g.1350 Transcript_387/m.1350 type:complete len:210 (+) Transcript_387:491-1120(+)
MEPWRSSSDRSWRKRSWRNVDSSLPTTPVPTDGMPMPSINAWMDGDRQWWWRKPAMEQCAVDTIRKDGSDWAIIVRPELPSYSAFNRKRAGEFLGRNCRKLEAMPWRSATRVTADQFLGQMHWPSDFVNPMKEKPNVVWVHTTKSALMEAGTSLRTRKKPGEAEERLNLYPCMCWWRKAKVRNGSWMVLYGKPDWNDSNKSRVCMTTWH